jgi:hypothetical protein
MAKLRKRFEETLSSVARDVSRETGRGISEGTIRRAADKGVIDSRRDASRRRLLASDSAARIVANWRATGSYSGPGRKAA